MDIGLATHTLPSGGTGRPVGARGTVAGAYPSAPPVAVAKACAAIGGGNPDGGSLAPEEGGGGVGGAMDNSWWN